MKLFIIRVRITLGAIIIDVSSTEQAIATHRIGELTHSQPSRMCPSLNHEKLEPWPAPCAPTGTSVAVVAEISVRSPRKLLIFII